MNSAERRELFELLEAGFPGIGWGARLARMEALGVAWERVSKPFVRYEAGRAVSHVGVMSLPLVVAGERVSAGAIHAVCTRAEARRRGHYRAAMEDALRYCDARFETLVLTTAQPELYEPFGFRHVGEHRFSLPVDSDGVRGGFRELRPGEAEDLSILRRLLEGRPPVSSVVGVEGEVAVFAFNETFRPLLYADGLDVIVSAEFEGTTLHLFDVVGRGACAVGEILERTPRRVERVVCYFSPDLLVGAEGALPEPHLLDGDDHLMVRGPFAAAGRAFMLPRTARC